MHVCVYITLLSSIENASAGDDYADEREIFDDDCRRFLAVTPDFLHGGIHGGEDEIVRDANFDPYRGGRPTRAESESENMGCDWHDRLRNSITTQRLI